MVSASTLLGAAGEHYVMSVLLRHDYIAALAPVGVPNCDIVVTDEIGDKLCAIQVKTRVDKGSDGGWHMSRKHESIASPGLFYAFLDFGRTLTEQPSCFIVPSAIVAQTVARSHQTWLSQPGKRGQERKDGELRRFMPDYTKVGLDIGCGPGWLEPYRDAWERLTSGS